MDFKIRRAGHVVLRVTDPHRARAFLEDVDRLPNLRPRGFVLFSHRASGQQPSHDRGARRARRRTLARSRAKSAWSASPTKSAVSTNCGASISASSSKGRPTARRSCAPKTAAPSTTSSCADHDGNRLEFFYRRSEEEAAGAPPFELRGPLDLDAPVTADAPGRAPIFASASVARAT